MTEHTIHYSFALECLVLETSGRQVYVTDYDQLARLLKHYAEMDRITIERKDNRIPPAELERAKRDWLKHNQIKRPKGQGRINIDDLEI